MLTTKTFAVVLDFPDGSQTDLNVCKRRGHQPDIPPKQSKQCILVTCNYLLMCLVCPVNSSTILQEANRTPATVMSLRFENRTLHWQQQRQNLQVFPPFCVQWFGERADIPQLSTFQMRCSFNIWLTAELGILVMKLVAVTHKLWQLPDQHIQ